MQVYDRSESPNLNKNSASNRKALIPEQLAKKKPMLTCRKRRKWGHWHSYHLENAKLKPNNLLRDKITNHHLWCCHIQYGNIADGSSDSSEFSSSLSVGPLLDDGTQCSGIGEQEFNLFLNGISKIFNGTYDDLPE